MRTALYAKLVRLSFGFYDRHQTGQLMSRATVDLQGVRFFLGYGLIFFFQHVFTIVGVGDRRLRHLVEARADRARDRAGADRASPTATATSRTRCCATCSRRWPTSRRSPRRTSSASTSSSRSRRRTREQAKFEHRSEAGLRAERAGEPPARASTSRCSASCRCSRRRRSCSSAGAWSRNGSLSVGDFVALQPLPRDARSCRCARSACGSARRSARPRRASASSR